MSDALIQVCWRRDLRITNTELLARIQSFLTNIDQSNISAIELGTSRANKACRFEIFEGVHMRTRYKAAVQRQASMHYDYLAKFIAVGIELVEMANYKRTCKMRQLLYVLGSHRLKHAAIKSVLRDWAVSLRLHPWSFGIVSPPNHCHPPVSCTRSSSERRIAADPCGSPTIAIRAADNLFVVDHRGQRSCVHSSEAPDDPRARAERV